MPAGQAQDDLEQEDDTQEIQGDDAPEEEEQDQEEQELPDYSEYSPQDLIKEARKLLEGQPIQKIKEPIEAIKKSLLGQLDEERDEKLQAFIEEGGHEIDFEYVQPLREEFRQIYRQFRRQRKDYYDRLRAELEENLRTKQGLIEQLKELVNKEESIGETFKEFNAIVDKWRSTGPVPRMESRDLWRTWHHHVENFYEYIKINKELRDLDYKKNLEKKEALIKQAEELLEWKDVPQAFRELQKLHQQWKHLGPVEPAQRETIWERFSELTGKLRQNREDFYENLRAKRGEMVEQKRQIVEKMKELPTDLSKHREWQEALQKIQELSEAFKKIGKQRHPENDAVWEEYRTVLRNFNRQKNDFYKQLKKQQQENLEIKRKLVEQAQALQESEDWKNTAQKLKKLQAQWKEVGHVPRKHSDKLWKEFRAACDHFFEKLKDEHRAEDKEREKHLEAKEELIQELEALEPQAKDAQKSVQQIKELIGRWKEIGPLPRGKGKIEKRFHQLLDQKFEALDLDRKESQKIKLENKVASLAGSGGLSNLQDERAAVQRKLDEAKQELNQLETNMSFFSSSDPKSPVVKEAQQKITKQKGKLKQLQQEHKMLNIKIRELQQEKQEAKKAPEDSGDPESQDS